MSAQCSTMRNRAGEPAALDRRLELAAKTRPLLGADQDAAEVAAAQPRHRGDKVEPALPPRQPARQHDASARRRAAAIAGRGWRSAGRRPARVEQVEVDAARDRAQPVGADAVDARRMIGDEIGDGDDPLAARHDRVVPPLQPRAGAIGVVKGGDEMPAGRAPPTTRSTPGRGSGHGRCRSRAGGFRAPRPSGCGA